MPALQDERTPMSALQETMRPMPALRGLGFTSALPALRVIDLRGFPVRPSGFMALQRAAPLVKECYLASHARLSLANFAALPLWSHLAKLSLVGVVVLDTVATRFLVHTVYPSKAKKGDLLDARDQLGAWHVARVLHESPSGSLGICYVTWSERWNEHIQRDSDRLAPLHTYSNRSAFAARIHRFLKTQFAAQPIDKKSLANRPPSEHHATQTQSSKPNDGIFPCAARDECSQRESDGKCRVAHKEHRQPDNDGKCERDGDGKCRVEPGECRQRGRGDRDGKSRDEDTAEEWVVERRLGDEEVSYIAGLSELRELALCSSDVGPVGCEWLVNGAAGRSLRCLHLSDCKLLTLGALRKLRGLPRLETLQIRGPVEMPLWKSWYLSIGRVLGSFPALTFLDVAGRWQFYTITSNSLLQVHTRTHLHAHTLVHAHVHAHPFFDIHRRERAHTTLHVLRLETVGVYWGCLSGVGGSSAQARMLGRAEGRA